MTERLYYHNAYQTVFQARVVDPDEDGPVALVVLQGGLAHRIALVVQNVHVLVTRREQLPVAPARVGEGEVASGRGCP